MTPPPAPKGRRKNLPASASGRNATSRVEVSRDTQRSQDAASALDGPAAANWMFGGATFVGGWHVEDLEIPGFNTPGLAIVYQPIVGSRQVAIDWIVSPAGRQWCLGALKLSLVSFVAIGEL